ncbi:Two-component transcriptional response regulator, LuxR family [hydrothermal vent metagenome]|uniref:Two-component transcriptional response regulator, LuxR family n=1 Tax=hydrothermal vent metagenome TaxID=652676 RepID=A0A3B0TSC6_9ZZZZ
MNPSTKEKPGHVLVVDDDREIRDLLGRFLKKHGYRVTAVGDGKQMRRALADWRIDLVVLDLMLPGEGGLALCRDLRAKSGVPIIMLTMMGEETDRIVGLEMGADDYLPKPFSPRELLARMRAVLRRAQGAPAEAAFGGPATLRFSGWTLDIGHRRVESPHGLFVDLSAGEFDLLVALAEHPQRVLSRDQLLDLTHGRTEALFDRSIDMQISRLRRKIETDPTQPELIKTVRGDGYIFTAAVTAQ